MEIRFSSRQCDQDSEVRIWSKQWGQHYEIDYVDLWSRLWNKQFGQDSEVNNGDKILK